MRAGELDRLVRIEVNTPTRSGTGAAIDGWALFAQVHARRMDARGREFFAGAQVTGEAATVWRIRWLAGVASAMRVREIRDGVPVAGEEWDIKFIQELGGRQEGLDLACTRLGA